MYNYRMKVTRFLVTLAAVGWIVAGCNRPWTGAGTLAALPTPPQLSAALPVTPQASTQLPPGAQQSTPAVPVPTSSGSRSTQAATPSGAGTPTGAGSPSPTQPRPAASSTPLAEPQVWFEPGTPADLRQSILAPGKIQPAALEGQATVRIGPGIGKVIVGQWVYALAAPFPTLADGVGLADLKSAWQGKPVKSLEGHGLIVSADTRAVFEKMWGPAAAAVRTVSPESLADTAWKEKTTWALLPFEEIQPRWKIMRVDGRSPLDKDFQAAGYGLSVAFGMDGSPALLEKLSQAVPQLAAGPYSNRDPKRLTVLMMTGTTALVRGSAYFMQTKGLLFPGVLIRDWLRGADLTHISNELSFNPKCPDPDPNDPNLRFCSQPQNIQLLEDVGTDIVELTGNHLNDFGSEWLGYSIEMFRQRGWLFYGGGVNQEQARKAITLEHNGNRIAFIGCNMAGPKNDWATSDKPGTADCEYPGMEYVEAEVRRLKEAGYLTIVTFQYFELVDPRPQPAQTRDFRRMADAGAIIVSGSQAHLPQAMELRNAGFIHYGLGNLFFDQMDTPWPDTKDEFLDRHIFYNGKYLGVELLTARLVEWVKPRPMTASERETMLRRIFAVSGWPDSSTSEWRITP